MSARTWLAWTDPAAATALAALAVEEDDVEAWRDSALCSQADPDAFFPEKGGSTRHAKQVCLACPVRVECLTYALDHDERFGIWGGLSERERRHITRERRRFPAALDEKTCTACGFTKPLSAFGNRRTRGGLESRCKTCRNAAQRERNGEKAA